MPNQFCLCDKDTTISHVAVFESLESLLDALDVHGELLDDGLDSVVADKCQHLPVDLTWSDDTALNPDTALDERQLREDEVVERDSKGVDCCFWGKDGEVKLPVWLLGCGDEQLVDGSLDLELLDTLCGVEFGRSELHRFILFAVGAREDDDLTAHLGGELDGQMAQPSDTYNANAVGAFEVVHLKCGENGGASAHERRGVLVLNAVWDLEDEVFVPDGVACETALVQLGLTIQVSSFAHGLFASQTLLAMSTAVVLVPPSRAITGLELCYVLANLLDNASAFVA